MEINHMQVEATGETYKVDDLLAAERDGWNARAKDFHERDAKLREIMSKQCALQAECAAYAKALTALVAPYTFSKYRVPSFKDDGMKFHDALPDYSLGNRETVIGSVDVWAASVVDPDFAKLVRENIAVIDKLNGRERVVDFDRYDPHHVAEMAPKAGFDVQWSDKVFSPLEPEMGTRTRVGRKLKTQFEALLNDPVKGPRMEKVRDTFITTFERVRAGQYASAAFSADLEATNELKNGLYHDSRRLDALAYLKLHGVTDITVAPGETVECAAEKRANVVDMSRAPFTVEVNDIMPEIVNPDLLPTLEKILADAGFVAADGVKKSLYDGIDTPQQPDRDTFIKKFMKALPGAPAPLG